MHELQRVRPRPDTELECTLVDLEGAEKVKPDHVQETTNCRTPALTMWSWGGIDASGLRRPPPGTEFLSKQ